MLLRLVESHQSKDIRSFVISLTPLDSVGKRLCSLGVEVIYLSGRSGRLPSIRLFRDLFSTVRRIGPDVIQGWMYHGNVAASLCRFILARDVPIIWNVRQSLGSLFSERFLTRVIILLCVPLSFGVHKIIYNSRDAAKQHERLGYSRRRTIFVPNGYSSTTRKLNNRRRLDLIVDTGKFLRPTTVVLGHAARYHPKKGHDVLFKALRRILELKWDVVLFCAGRNSAIGSHTLGEIIPNGIDEERYILLGEQEDMEGFYQSLDIFISSSKWGEGFPNVVAEAMNHHIPCVATDVGEARSLIGDHGVVVPPNNAEALAEGIITLLRIPREERTKCGAQAGKWVRTEYGMETIGATYFRIYMEAIQCSART